jgi:hypothetical protein
MTVTNAKPHARAGDWIEVSGLPGRAPRRGQILEDCASLDVVLVLGEELRRWDPTVVHKSAVGGAPGCR